MSLAFSCCQFCLFLVIDFYQSACKLVRVVVATLEYRYVDISSFQHLFIFALAYLLNKVYIELHHRYFRVDDRVFCRLVRQRINPTVKPAIG